MAQQIIKMVIQLRRAHTSEWDQYKDIVPAAGEPCFDLDLNTLKIGDGVKKYWELEPIGGKDDIAVAADGSSITLKDGIFQLTGFDAAAVGAQPQKGEDGNIVWVVPSNDAVEDLQTAVSELQSNVTNLTTNVTNLQEIVAPSGEGAVTLLERIEGLEYKMDETGEGTVDEKINKKIDEFVNLVNDTNTIDTFRELVTYVANHGSEVETIVADITSLQSLVGEDTVSKQISDALLSGDYISAKDANDTFLSKVEANDTLLSKVDGAKTFERVKYEIADTPIGTLVDYREKEIRIMVPADAQFTKQAVGAGGDADTYYMTFKTYAPKDNVVGYIEHLGDQVDSEILTSFHTDQYGRRYQPTWLGLAKYDGSSWNYYGKDSTVNSYVGWDYQIDWYDADGVMVASDKIRINLSNEGCHHNIEPYFIGSAVKEVSVGGTLLDMIDSRVDIPVGAGLKASEEVEIADDGTLGIGKISFNKIVQDDETTLIMDGGGAV